MTTSGRCSRMELKRRILEASIRKSSWFSRIRPNSLIINNKGIPRKVKKCSRQAASQRSRRRSARINGTALGRRIFTATTCPSLKCALWTCEMLPHAVGVHSKSRKMRPGGTPRPAVRRLAIWPFGIGLTCSHNRLNGSVTVGENTSGRELSTCASLTKVGPSRSSSDASDLPRALEASPLRYSCRLNGRQTSSRHPCNVSSKHRQITLRIINLELWLDRPAQELTHSPVEHVYGARSSGSG